MLLFPQDVLGPEPGVFLKLSCPLKIIIETSNGTLSCEGFFIIFFQYLISELMQKQEEDQVIVTGVSGEKWGMRKIEIFWIWKTELHYIFY